MSKLIVTEFLTLDGIAQAPGTPDSLPASRLHGETDAADDG
jgi:hypothetical protein